MTRPSSSPTRGGRVTSDGPPSPPGRTAARSPRTSTTLVAGSTRSRGMRSGSTRRSARRSRAAVEKVRSRSDSPIRGTPSTLSRCLRHTVRPVERTDLAERSSLLLAALASVAVPGLDPVSVELVPSDPQHDYDLAFVTDSTDRRWMVRAPRTAAAAARMEMSLALLPLLARRVPFGVPAPKGFVALKEGGRACVYPALPGHTVDFTAIPAGRGLAVELGRAIAALHNLDARLFDEAGLPAYDPDAYRTRRLADLDRAAATGRVPTTLLTRWESALEDVNLWRFAPTPIHGDLTGDQVLAVFTDEEDASTGTIKAFTGWEGAKVADPADDFAGLVAEADPETLETVLEAYAHARVERPDANLLVRARLASELGLLAELTRALTAGWDEAADAHTAALRRLDDEVHAQDAAEDDYRRTSLAPTSATSGSRRPTASRSPRSSGSPKSPRSMTTSTTTSPHRPTRTRTKARRSRAERPQGRVRPEASPAAPRRSAPPRRLPARRSHR